MDILDDIVQAVSEALRQGYFVPAVSLNSQAYQEFLSLCTHDYTLPEKPCNVAVLAGNHPERIKAAQIVQVQY